MFQKLSSVVLLLLMGVVVATSQPGLRYCLCYDELFVGCCQLCDSAVSSSESGECDACDCCQEDFGDLELKPGGAIGNCFVELHLELGKFIKSDSPVVPDEEMISRAGLASPMVEAMVNLQDRIVDRKERAPPPSMGTFVPVPVFLRHSVFLI